MSNEQLPREDEADITVDELDAAVGEILYNGEEIDWDYWAGRQKITARQAAILAYGIDPIKWPDGEFKWGAWPQRLREKIQRLYEWLADRNDTYTLQQLVAALGDDFASSLMKEAALASSPSAPEPAANEIKKKALVEKYRQQWPSAESDINEGSRNGLGQAKTRPGYYDEGKAIQWAKRQGKFREVATAANSIFNAPTSLVHRAK